MNTDRIAYFLAVVREGSFSAAAKNMYVSQTAISQQIASLEKEMGCALFHRLSTGAVLTDQGEQFLPYAERLLGIQLELQDAFADAHRVSAIHIGYNGPLEKELIVDAYLSLHPHLPNLVIHPLYLSLTAMSDALYRGQCDMVLTLPGEIDQRNTYQEVLYDVPMIAAVSEASPLAEKSVVSLSDLRAYPLILLALDQSRSGAARSRLGTESGISESVNYLCGFGRYANFDGFAESGDFLLSSEKAILFQRREADSADGGYWASSVGAGVQTADTGDSDDSGLHDRGNEKGLNRRKKQRGETSSIARSPAETTKVFSNRPLDPYQH